MLLGVWALVPVSWATRRPYIEGKMFSHDTITILSPFVSSILSWGSITVAACLLILSIRSKRWPRIEFPIVALLIAVVAFPCAGIAHIFSNLAPWTLHGRVTDSDGESYVFCDSSFLQGQLMAIGSIETENLLATEIKVLGVTNGDSPRSWASVIRPANPQNTYGQLYLTDQQMLVGIRYGNHCFLAYDLVSKKFYGHGDIKKASPFICLNADDELHVADLETIRKLIKESTADMNGYPHRDALESSIRHRNPRVRAVAESLLGYISEQLSAPYPD